LKRYWLVHRAFLLFAVESAFNSKPDAS
jgi:hypothetical protein